MWSCVRECSFACPCGKHDRSLRHNACLTLFLESSGTSKILGKRFFFSYFIYRYVFIMRPKRRILYSVVSVIFCLFVCLFVDTITLERLNQFEPNFHT